jgi:hypothetical protein
MLQCCATRYLAMDRPAVSPAMGWQGGSDAVRGHIRKRGITWTVVVDLGPDDGGKRQQKWHSGFRTKRDAERALTEILNRIGSGAYIDPGTMLRPDTITDGSTSSPGGPACPGSASTMSASPRLSGTGRGHAPEDHGRATRARHRRHHPRCLQPRRPFSGPTGVGSGRPHPRRRRGHRQRDVGKMFANGATGP